MGQCLESCTRFLREISAFCGSFPLWTQFDGKDCGTSLSSADSSTRGPHSRPFFRCHAHLAIPNVIMTPPMDEVQQTVNKVAHCVVAVARGVSQWSKERKTAAQMNASKMVDENAVGFKASK